MKHSIGVFGKFVVTSLSFILVYPFPSIAQSVCLDGYYDFGPQAAVLGFSCDSPGEAAKIFFCKRSTLLEKGVCTGSFQKIKCQWLNDDMSWFCEEKGNYPFKAQIQKLNSREIRYQFKSSFNEGELIGKLLNLN